jgi:oxaloacetate decarboxylase gamma subunit
LDSNLIASGLELMLYGMGTVVIFLTLLVYVTSGMSALVLRFTPEEPAAAPGPGKPAAVDGKLLAVISAAIHEHRSRR